MERGEGYTVRSYIGTSTWPSSLPAPPLVPTSADSQQRLSSAEAILKLPLECHHCGKPFDSIPKLKSHYDEEFDERRRLHSKKG